MDIVHARAHHKYKIPWSATGAAHAAFLPHPICWGFVMWFYLFFLIYLGLLMPSPPFIVFSISNWLHIVLRCSLNTVLVFLSIGFDLTFINVPLLRWFSFGYIVACSYFFVGLQNELLDISRFMTLLMPLGYAISDVPCGFL